MLAGLLAVSGLLVSSQIALNPVEDTYIDVQMPDTNFGHDLQLIANPKSYIFLKFPSPRWISPLENIESATLDLKLTDDADVKLVEARKVLSPWAEGCGLRLPLIQTNNELALKGTVTWNSSLHGTAKWQLPGAMGERDSSPLQGITAVKEGGVVHILGLKNYLTQVRSNPSQDFGIRLEFSSPVSFMSSETNNGPELRLGLGIAQTKGPKLAVLNLGSTSPGTWQAEIQNIGDSPATGYHCVWSFKGAQIAESRSQEALAPGEKMTVHASFDIKFDSKPNKNQLNVIVEAGGQGSEANELGIYPNGLPIKFVFEGPAIQKLAEIIGSEPETLFLQRIVSATNEGVLAQSKSSFSPSGCYERFRLALASEPAISVKISQFDSPLGLIKKLIQATSTYRGSWLTPPETMPWPITSLGAAMDTRDETLWPTTLMLPQFPWGDSKPSQPPLHETGLLSRAEIASFNALAGQPISSRDGYVPPVTEAVVVVVTDGSGAPISDAEVEVYRAQNGKLMSDPIYKLTTTSNGYLILGKKEGKGVFSDLQADGSNSWCLMRVTKNFVTETTWLSAKDVAAEAARGNSAAFIELRLNLPSGSINVSENLALDRSISDSQGHFPAELMALVDGKSDTAFEISKSNTPYTLDIDLGKDRLIAGVEIETKAGIWKSFRLSTLKTGQRPTEFETWFSENAGDLRLALNGKSNGSNQLLTYYANAVRAKILRLTVLSSEPIQVAEIRIRTLNP